MNFQANSFLIDCLKYKVGASTEDRLTAIVTSSFNHSFSFKKAFCRFLKIKYRRELIAHQQYPGDKSRPDLVITSGEGRIVALVESKTEAEINFKQLKNHSAIPAENRYFISKFTIDRSRMPRGWLSLQWRDLIEEIVRFKKDFICNEVSIYLKENKMIPPAQLSRMDIENCSKFLNSVRYHVDPEISNLLASLESLNKVATMLQFAVREIIVEEKKFAGKRPKVKLTYFYNDYHKIKSVSRKRAKTDEDLRKMHSYANTGLAVFCEMEDKSKPFLALRMNSDLGISWGRGSRVSHYGEIIAGSFGEKWTYEGEKIIEFKKGKLSLNDLKKQLRKVWL